MNKSNNAITIRTSPDNQNTIANELTFCGIGIFSGQNTSITLKPASINTGIIFHNGKKEIPAKISCVNEIPNRTRLEKNGFTVQVVEHLLGALYGLHIDNAIVDVAADEVPICDASAVDFVSGIIETGIVEQNEPAIELVINHPIGIEEDDKSIWLMPDSTPRISYFLDHEHPRIGMMSDSFILSEDNFTNLIAPSRTFATKEEARYMIENKIVGTDDEHLAVVVDENGPNQPLRHPFEYVHHKMLDMIGDLSLAHNRIIGHFIGIRTGHLMNRKLARAIHKLMP